MKRYLRYARSVLILVAGLVIGFEFGFFYSLPCLILAVFIFLVDVRGIDKAAVGPPNNDPVVYGTIAEFVVDSTKLYGMYIDLNRTPVFIDIKQDALIDKRKQYATLLRESGVQLEKSLKLFLELKPDFRAKRLAYIGLHSTELDAGEVFWEPDGHTLLRGTQFLPG
jgi:hypothetical protein